MNSLKYVRDAIQRLEQGEIVGSHTEGVFSRAANQVEKDVRAFAQEVMDRNDLEYGSELRNAVKGAPLEKLTLGQLVALFREVGNKSTEDFTSLIADMATVNDIWVNVKHGNAVGANFRGGLEAIESIHRSLEQEQTS
jgi:hypothetical protein